MPAGPETEPWTLQFVASDTQPLSEPQLLYLSAQGPPQLSWTRLRA